MGPPHGKELTTPPLASLGAEAVTLGLSGDSWVIGIYKIERLKMNFYIGTNIDEIDINQYNIEIYDEIFEQIIKAGRQLNVDVSMISNIDPYDDCVINYQDVKRIVDLCDVVIERKLLDNYLDPKEGYEMITGLKAIAMEAIKNKEGLVSIGD